jgi:hypothetical protein
MMQQTSMMMIYEQAIFRRSVLRIFLIVSDTQRNSTSREALPNAADYSDTTHPNIT